MTDLERLEKKIDLIIDAFGLGKQPKMAPAQRREFVDGLVLKFEEKRRKKHAHDGEAGQRRGI